MSTNINKVNQEFFLSRSQYQARYNAGTLVVGAIYHITDEDFVSTDNIEDTVTSSSADKVLSAKQGKILNDRIDNLEALGRFLSLWNCETGLPKTNPSTLPYTYKTGDYYRINVVDETTNYMPNGTSYDGTASTTEYTGSETIEVGDVWFYDGTSWSLMTQKVGGFVEDVEVNGSSVVSGGVAILPKINVNQFGVAALANQAGIESISGGHLILSTPNEAGIIGRSSSSNFGAITVTNYDLAVKHALTDTDGTANPAYTTTEKQAARNKIGASSVSGTNDGTNWQTITIDGVQKAIPVGGSSGASLYPVTFTEANNTITASKTITEIIGAYTSGDIVVGKLDNYVFNINAISTDASNKYIFLTTVYGMPSGHASFGLFGSVSGGNDIWIKSFISFPARPADVSSKSYFLKAATNDLIWSQWSEFSFSDLGTNVPKYNNSAMTTSTNIPEVKTATWDGKSTVSVSTSSGTSENVAKFITVDGTEYKLGGGIFYEEIVDSFTVTITDPRNDMPAAIYDGTNTSGTLLGYTTMAAKTVTVSSGHLYMVTSGSWNPAVSVTGGVTISSGGALNGQMALFDVSADGTITASTKE